MLHAITCLVIPRVPFQALCLHLAGAPTVFHLEMHVRFAGSFAVWLLGRTFTSLWIPIFPRRITNLSELGTQTLAGLSILPEVGIRTLLALFGRLARTRCFVEPKVNLLTFAFHLVRVWAVWLRTIAKLPVE